MILKMTSKGQASVLKFDPYSAAKGQDAVLYHHVSHWNSKNWRVDPTSGATQYCCDLLVTYPTISLSYFLISSHYSITSHHYVPPICSITMFQQYVPSLSFMNIISHHYVPAICSITMFHQYNIPSLCSINMFHQYVPSICSMNMFHQYVPWLCYINVPSI